jgi:hypothetical protein
MRSSHGFMISGILVDSLPSLTMQQLEKQLEFSKRNLLAGFNYEDREYFRTWMEEEEIEPYISEMMADIECSIALVTSEISSRQNGSL